MEILCLYTCLTAVRFLRFYVFTFFMDGELLADQPLGQKLIKKWFWLYFFTILIAPTGYFIRVLVSNSVSVADVGIIYSIMWLMGILSAYHDLGLTEALQYHLPKYRIQKKYNAFKTSILFTFIVQAVTGIIIAFLLFYWADFLAANYFHSAESAYIIKIFCLYFLGVNFFNMLYSIYIAFQDIIQYKLIDGIKSYTTLIFTLCFFLLGTLDITNFTRAWMIGLWVSLLISGILFIKKYWYTLSKWEIERDYALLKKQIKYAFWVFIWINVTLLLSQIDQQFIIYFLWAQSAWYYANYLSLILSFNILSAPFLGYLFPLTTELIQKNENEKLRELKSILYKYFSLFALSVSSIFIVLWPEIATILFGVKFMYSWELLSYSAGFLIFYVLFGINFSLLAGMGKVKQRAKIIAIALLANIVLNFIFIHLRWIVGVIAATIISWIMLFVMSYRLVNKQREIIWDRWYVIKNLLVIIVLSTIIFLYKNNIFVLEDSDRYKNLIYFVLIGVGYYLIIGLINWWNIKLFIKEIKKIWRK